MSKLLKTLIVALLSFTLLFSFAGCQNDDGDGATVTGDLVYKIQEDEDDNHKYYAVTGYTVTSEDAVKIATGDFSSFTDEQREFFKHRALLLRERWGAVAQAKSTIYGYKGSRL